MSNFTTTHTASLIRATYRKAVRDVAREIEDSADCLMAEDRRDAIGAWLATLPEGFRRDVEDELIAMGTIDGALMDIMAQVVRDELDREAFEPDTYAWDCERGPY